MDGKTAWRRCTQASWGFLSIVPAAQALMVVCAPWGLAAAQVWKHSMFSAKPLDVEKIALLSLS